jgi:hypothetical protein
MPTSQVKPFDIPMQMVWEAYRRVAANEGAPGVDRQTLGEFEDDLKNNLVIEAMQTDPLAGRLDARRLEEMTDELLAATGEWLPRFAQ